MRRTVWWRERIRGKTHSKGKRRKQQKFDREQHKSSRDRTRELEIHRVLVFSTESQSKAEQLRSWPWKAGSIKDRWGTWASPRQGCCQNTKQAVASLVYPIDCRKATFLYWPHIASSTKEYIRGTFKAEEWFLSKTPNKSFLDVLIRYSPCE